MMHNQCRSKLVLLVAALFLIVGVVSLEDASAASVCKKDCKGQKKTCLNSFKVELKADKGVCNATKSAGNASCKATKSAGNASCSATKSAVSAECTATGDAAVAACGSDKQCLKEVKKTFKLCKKAMKKDYKACKKAVKTDDRTCKKAVKTDDKACKQNAKAKSKSGKWACNGGSTACNTCCKSGSITCTIVNCGDGVQVPGEECDDANTVSGDGCSSPACQIESGYECTGSPSVCALRCGNGVIDAGEECDTTSDGCPAEYLCIPSGSADECTCAEPCRLDPVPTALRFTSEIVTGNCGCTLTSADDTSCDAPSKLGDLECGQLYLGGGLSAVPPGPAPDGATNYVEFPQCRGTTLIVGPSAGTSHKDCTFGASEPEGPCYYGPALSIENKDPGMSTCVLNTLRENVDGVMDPTTGHSTMRVELTSRVYLTGDMIKSTCMGGPNHAAPCSRQGVAKRGGTCEGGFLENSACASDVDCEGGGTCIGICGACSNDGNSCQDDTDCTGGGVCEGLCADEADGECDDSGEQCRLKGVCDGSANPGLQCETSDDCSGFCVGGTVEGRLCSRDSQCRGGTCSDRDTCKGTCIGPGSSGAFCTDDSDCDAGTCGFSDCPTGTCVQVGRPVQPCPTCVDENYKPVTDAETVGTCNLGASKGMACVSTNTLGLTTDCLPIGGPVEEVGEGKTGTYLADIDVTIPAITTGKAEMIADEDGTFCNFGYCVGGSADGEQCNNNWDCAGGACQKYCQVLGGADKGVNEGGTDPDDDPTCEVDDDCLEPGVTGWRPCGQSDPGAFTGDVDGQILGGATVRRFILEGEPAPAPVEIGEIKEAKLVAAFCIPRTGDQAIDNAGSLPGPGSTSLKGSFELLREE